ncbi:MAG: PatB family C-S lyase [Bacteroidales bacterium]|jgi:cystathionine beta-lyase|nr:PatB family C-S lyase [Bacteroidales bacterium]
MQYNFDKIINRDRTASVKFDLRKEVFGKADILPMWVADMDFETPGFVIEALRKRLDHPVLGYSYRPDSYYHSIINWVKRRHRWTIKQEWISFSPGIVPAINMAMMAFTEPGDKIIVQPPVYHPFFSAIKNNHRVQVENPLKLKKDRYFMDFEDLKVKLKNARMILLSNPHNPGGSVWTKEELQTLGDLCVENDVLIMADEIHSDLVFKPAKYVPMASVSPEIARQTVTFIAPSKTFNMAGLATSSVITSNPSLKEKYDQMLDTIHIGMGNIFGTVASEAAYTHGDEWLDELLEYLSQNMDYTEQFITDYLPEIKIIRPEGTYLMWLDCSGLDLKNKDLKDFMIQDAGLGFNDGRMFGTGGEQFMRMNVACPKVTIKQALTKLKEAVHQL